MNVKAIPKTFCSLDRNQACTYLAHCNKAKTVKLSKKCCMGTSCRRLGSWLQMILKTEAGKHSEPKGLIDVSPPHQEGWSPPAGACGMVEGLLSPAPLGALCMHAHQP